MGVLVALIITWYLFSILCWMRDVLPAPKSRNIAGLGSSIFWLPLPLHWPSSPHAWSGGQEAWIFLQIFYNSSIDPWWLKHSKLLKVTNQWILVIELGKRYGEGKLISIFLSDYSVHLSILWCINLRKSLLLFSFSNMKTVALRVFCWFFFFFLVCSRSHNG